MKPAPFAYVRAASLDQTFDLLARHGDEARVLASGRSLIPTLNMRLSTAALLIDINGLEELSGIAVQDGALRIGALTRQHHERDQRRARPLRRGRHHAARNAGADPARARQSGLVPGTIPSCSMLPSSRDREAVVAIQADPKSLDCFALFRLSQ